MKLGIGSRGINGPEIHEERCACLKCRVTRIAALDAAFREELAGRLDALEEAAPRPEHWRPRPGTKKAIERRYGSKRRRAA